MNLVQVSRKKLYGKSPLETFVKFVEPMKFYTLHMFIQICPRIFSEFFMVVKILGGRVREEFLEKLLLC